MDLRLLPCFQEVERHGSLSAAARSMRISQPAVSKMIAALEESLGAPLFTRVRRGVVVTEAGRRLLSRCERIRSELDGIQRDFEKAATCCEGTLEFGASDNLCNYLIPPVLSGFASQHPRLKMRLLSGTATAISQALCKGELDFGLFYHLPKERDLQAQAIAQIRFSLVLRPDLKRSGRWRELPFIGSRRDDYDRPYPALRLLKNMRIKPRLIHETNNQESQKRLVLAGLGYSVLPRFMTSAELEAGELVEIESPGSYLVSLYRVKRKKGEISRAGQLLLNAIQEGFMINARI